MASIEGSIVIHRPPEVVFDFVADERNEPLYNPEMLRVEQVSPGPIGVGTQFRAESRRGSRTIDMLIEFTEFDRPSHLSSRTHLSGMDIQGALTFAPIPEGTEMRWAWELHPRGILNLFGTVITRMGRRQEQAIWGSLKRYLEDGTSRPGDG